MHIIPVLDLLHASIVRGVSGKRESYRQLETQLTNHVYAANLVKIFIGKFGISTVYVADLDAILKQQPNFDIYHEVHKAGAHFWLDAGLATSAQAAMFWNKLQSEGLQPTLIFGLESLQDTHELQKIMELQLPHPIFSLDLKAGQPMTTIAAWKQSSPLQIAREVIAAGFTRLILLDLATVGTEQGNRTLDLIASLHNAFPTVEIIAGGGVRNVQDLQALQSAHCSAALVATALHNGNLTAEQIASFRA